MNDQATSEQSATTTPPQAVSAGDVMQMAASQGTPVLPAHRPGWQTTEFWVTVFTLVGIFATALVGVLPSKSAAIAAGVATAAYSVSRAIAKLGTTLF